MVYVSIFLHLPAGVYSWLTINYLLDRFDAEHHHYNTEKCVCVCVCVCVCARSESECEYAPPTQLLVMEGVWL